MKGKQRNELRREMKKIVANLDPRWIKAASNELCSHLDTLIENEIDREIRRVLAWTSFFPGEVDLSPFISRQLERREVYLPRSLPDRTMTFLSVNDDWNRSCQAGYMGIPEPGAAGASLFVPEDTEDCVVVVPGLAFDRFGNRIGRGKGYYDRFLGMQEMSASVNVGVCWKLQMVGQVYPRDHDIRMNWICHEEGLLDTGLEFADLSGELREEE